MLYSGVACLLTTPHPTPPHPTPPHPTHHRPLPPPPPLHSFFVVILSPEDVTVTSANTTTTTTSNATSNTTSNATSNATSNTTANTTTVVAWHPEQALGAARRLLQAGSVCQQQKRAPIQVSVTSTTVESSAEGESGGGATVSAEPVHSVSYHSICGGYHYVCQGALTVTEDPVLVKGPGWVLPDTADMVKGDVFGVDVYGPGLTSGQRCDCGALLWVSLLLRLSSLPQSIVEQSGSRVNFATCAVRCVVGQPAGGGGAGPVLVCERPSPPPPGF